MKTNKLPRKSRFDLGLTIAGWTLAIFVSLLYLQEKAAHKTERPSNVGSTPITAATTSPESVRVATLLSDARSAMMQHRPEIAINCVTTIWSICHSNQQDVPEETHFLFAQAVSQMSERDKNSGVQHYSNKVEAYPEVDMDQALPTESTGETVVVSEPDKTTQPKKPAKFELPKSDYPQAKKKSVASQPHKQPRRPNRPRRPQNVNDGPAHIPVYNPANRQRGRHQRPGQARKNPRNHKHRTDGPPPHHHQQGNRSGSFPPPPPGSSFPTPPMDSQDGGRPPGY